MTAGVASSVVKKQILNTTNKTNKLMNRKLENKVAVVTGGGEGIGLGAAKRFAAEGARVFITGRRQSELNKALTTIEGNVTAIQGRRL
jgi:ribulose 1,5-bisphosphate synthetase/thiazole synthase